MELYVSGSGIPASVNRYSGDAFGAAKTKTKVIGRHYILLLSIRRLALVILINVGYLLVLTTLKMVMVAHGLLVGFRLPLIIKQSTEIL